MCIPEENKPKGAMKRIEGRLPIRDRNSKAQKKQAIPRTWSQKPKQILQPLSGPDNDGLQFINLLGTEKHDTQGRNTVRSHARRHAWKNQKEQQGKTKQPRVLMSNHGNQSPPSCRLTCDTTTCALPSFLPPGAQSYYTQCSKIREIAQLLPQRSTDAAQESLYRTRTWLGDNAGYTNFPSGLGGSPEAAIAIVSHPSISHIKLTHGYSDPFDVFPIPLTPRLHHLMHTTKYIGGVVHEDPRDTFSLHMGNSPALVFATLAWTSALSAPGSETRNAESQYYLHQSITAINNELSNVNRSGLTDGTIAAVACLTNMENLNGDKFKARIHMNGLRQMVAMRGGMNRLGMNGVLRRLVLWADVFSATRWQSIPMFSLVELPDLLYLVPLCWFRNPATPKPHFVIKNDALIHAANNTGNGNLVSLMKGVYELAHFLDNAPPRDSSLLDRASFPDRIFIIEHKILCLVSQNQRQSQPSSIILPLLHSLLLYIYTNIRLTPVEGRIRLTLISRLQEHLQRANLGSLNENFPHELRWALFLGGGAASKGTKERAFFIRQLLNCGCRREWGSWENIVLLLKGIESGFLIRCEEFWQEALAIRDADLGKYGTHGSDCAGEGDFFMEYNPV